MQSDCTRAFEKRIIALGTREGVNAVHRVNVVDRLAAIEDTLRWLVRLIVGGLIVAALTFVIEGGLT